MHPGYLYLKKALAKKTLWLACGLVLLSMLACRSCSIPPIPAATPSPQPTVGVDELRFKDPEAGQQFRSLNACIQDFVDETWRTSYHLSANYYQLRWCRGEGASPDCQTLDPTSDRRDQHIIELFTKFYQDFPEVIGLGIRAHWVPETTGWKAWFGFFGAGGSEGGEGWGVKFSEYSTSTGRPEVIVELGDEYSYKIIETYIKFSTDLPTREDLALHLAGPEAMRDRGQAQIRILSQLVETEISTHQVMACDWDPYQGGGIPPMCTPRPMDPAEEATELARAEAYFADQDQLLRDHYQDMYAAWMKAFPLDQCWPK